MSMANKKYTEKEKLSILKEADHKGVTKTLAKYGLFLGTYYYWRKKCMLAEEIHVNVTNAKK